MGSQAHARLEKIKQEFERDKPSRARASWPAARNRGDGQPSFTTLVAAEPRLLSRAPIHSPAQDEVAASACRGRGLYVYAFRGENDKRVLRLHQEALSSNPMSVGRWDRHHRNHLKRSILSLLSRCLAAREETPPVVRGRLRACLGG